MLKWKDPRYKAGCGEDDKSCAKNKKRKDECRSNQVQVDWDDDDDYPLWLPYVDVRDFIDVVYHQLYQKKF